MIRIRTAVVTAATVSMISLGALVVPAEAAPSPSTPAVEPSSLVYTVKSGDYLAGVAHKLKVTLNDLLTVNKIELAHVIHPGDKLVVPAGGSLPATTKPASGSSAAANTTYVVVAGDYLAGIAVKNGVTLKALLDANKLTATSAIYPGTKLTVPPATRPIPPAFSSGATISQPASATASAAKGAAATAAQTAQAAVVSFLKAQVGKPYQFNAAGPDSYDCSGLVSAAYDRIGIALPHQSLLQSLKGAAVDWNTEALQPGDLIFQYSSAKPTVISHVGIVIDSKTWIQAARPGESVKLRPLPAASKIVAVRRIVSP
jgi:peptidoglycan DL-endopeptidase CwlO